MLKVRLNVIQAMSENQTQAKKFVGAGALVFGLENMVTLIIGYIRPEGNRE